MSALERWESFRLSLWCRLRIGETASEKLVNKNLETGTIEVEVESYTILNKAKELPIQVEEMGWILTKKLGCAIATLICRVRIQKIMRMRSKFIRAIREAYYAHDFVEVETPMLTKATKRARDFSSIPISTWQILRVPTESTTI